MKNVMHWRHTPANKTFVFKTALCYLYCRYIVVVVLVLNENVVVDTIFSHCNFANLFKLFFAYVKMMQFLTLKWHIIPRWKVKLKMGTFTPFFLQYWHSVLPYTVSEWDLNWTCWSTKAVWNSYVISYDPNL